MLDLDKTLVDVVCIRGPKGEKYTSNIGFSFDTFVFEGDLYVVMVRPGGLEFLANSKHFWDIYVYTHALRDYALQVLKVINKSEQLLSSDKLLTRESDYTWKPVLKNLNHFAYPEKCVIVDDNLYAWNLKWRK